MSNETRFNLNDYKIMDIHNLNPYQVVLDTYNGNGMIRNGSLLVPYSRESFYPERKALAYYRNYTKPIINSMVETVFDSPIYRETNNELFKKFLEDVDNKKTDMTQYSLDIVTLARLLGVVFVVMDNFSETPNTISDAINSRMIPYIYYQLPQQVKTYKTDEFGNLVSIEFWFKDIEMDGKKLKMTNTWDDMTLVKTIYDGDKIYKQQIVYHNLGVLPIISVYGTNRNEVLPFPPYYDLSILNVAIYNKDSELRDQERSQAFSLLYAQLDTNNTNLTVGTHSMIALPVDPALTITPGYVSPDSGVLAHLMNSIDALIKSIYQLANQNGVTGVKSASSGIAEAYKFAANNSQLKKTATIAENFEKDLAELFCKYIKNSFEYIVKYTKNYDTFYSSISTDDITKLLALDLPVEIKNEIKKVAVKKYLDNLDNDKLNELDKIIDESVEEDVEETKETKETNDNGKSKIVKDMIDMMDDNDINDINEFKKKMGETNGND